MEYLEGMDMCMMLMLTLQEMFLMGSKTNLETAEYLTVEQALEE
jgi:hypothetical protein